MASPETRKHIRLGERTCAGVRCSAWFLAMFSMLTGALRAAEPQVFPVADFGASGDGKTDDRTPIQRAIDAAVKADGPAVVRFESGKIYRLAKHCPANGMLIVAGAEDLTLDGAGATLLCHPSNRILAIHASKRIGVRNFTLDYAPLPFTQGCMQTVDAEAGYVEFQPSAGYSPPVLGGEELYNDFKDSDCVFVRADRRLTHSWLRIRGITERSPGLFRCTFHGTNVAAQLRRTKVGDFIVVKMKYPQGETLRTPDGRFVATPVANINVSFSEHVLLENITSYAAPGTIAGCTFDDVAYGVHAFVNGPIEGCMPREIRVRNCTFRHNTVSALALAVPSPEAAPPSRFTLDVTECRFVAGGNQGRLLSAYNVTGVSLRDSSVAIGDGRTLRSLIMTQNCSEVDVAGVRVE